MAIRICTIGNLTIDDIILLDTQQIFPECIGGNALYAAIGTRVWNGEPTMICRVGKSFPPAELVKVPSFGIQTCLVEVACRDIHNWALYERGGGRQFINHLTSGSNEELSIRGPEIPAGCLGADAYHVAPMPTPVQRTVVERLAKAHGLISWDPHLKYLSAPGLNKMAYEILGMIDLFLPSQEEAAALFGSDDMMAAARNFADAGPGVVAIKMSTRGSLVYNRQTRKFHHIPIYPCQAVDPTGAGDAYCGGFLVGYLETGDPLTAACYGTVSASYVVEHVGALNTFQSDFSTAQSRLKPVKEQIAQW